MSLTKKTMKAVEEGLPLFWTYEGHDPFESRTVTGGWTLRATTGLFENGTTRSRKLFQSLDRPSAEQVHRALSKMGITPDQYGLSWERKLGEFAPGNGAREG